MAGPRGAGTVVVVGLGVVGLATALALARRGTHVVGVDRLGSGHAHTSSTGLSRSIRVAYALPDYARLAVEALDRWAQLEERSGDRLLHLTGQLDIGPPEVLAGLTFGLRAAGAGYEELTAADIRRRVPEVAIADDACGLFHPRAGAVLADRAMAALAAAAAAAGSELRSPERVGAVIATPNGVRVTTEAGAIDADRAVIAAGPWTPALVRPLGVHLPLAPAYGQVTYFAAPAFVDVPGFVEWGGPVSAASTATRFRVSATSSASTRPATRSGGPTPHRCRTWASSGGSRPGRRPACPACPVGRCGATATRGR